MTDEAQMNQTRVRQRARELWQAAGAPEGKEAEYEERARELIAIEDNAEAGKEPLPESGRAARLKDVEAIEAVENQGEFPTLTDQGEETTAPEQNKTSDE